MWVFSQYYVNYVKVFFFRMQHSDPEIVHVEEFLPLVFSSKPHSPHDGVAKAGRSNYSSVAFSYSDVSAHLLSQFHSL